MHTGHRLTTDNRDRRNNTHAKKKERENEKKGVRGPPGVVPGSAVGEVAFLNMSVRRLWPTSTNLASSALVLK